MTCRIKEAHSTFLAAYKLSTTPVIILMLSSATHGVIGSIAKLGDSERLLQQGLQKFPRDEMLLEFEVLMHAWYCR